MSNNYKKSSKRCHQNLPHHQHQSYAARGRRQIEDNQKLPTPPPDPRCPQEPIPESKYTQFAAAIATEQTFLHLDRLYRLMEHILDLREQNLKLHKKLCDLEHLHSVTKCFSEPSSSYRTMDLNRSSAQIEPVLETILNSAGKLPSPTISKIDVRSTAKISKWSKVKTAFRWEKASALTTTTTTPGGCVKVAKSQDSGLGGINVFTEEGSRFLRIPSTDLATYSPSGDSGNAEISTPATLSTASSSENLQQNDNKVVNEGYISRAKNSSLSTQLNYSKLTNENEVTQELCPCCSKKDFFVNTDTSDNDAEPLIDQSDDIQSNIIYANQMYSNVINNRKTNEEVENEGINSNCENLYLQSDKDAEESKWNHVKHSLFLKHSLTSTARCSNDIGTNSVYEEIEKNYRELQEKLSEEFRTKLTEWERSKKQQPILTQPTQRCSSEHYLLSKRYNEIPSQTNLTRRLCKENLPPEFQRKIEEWEQMKRVSIKSSAPNKRSICQQRSIDSNPGRASILEYPAITDEFRKKLDQWKTMTSVRNSRRPTNSSKSANQLNLTEAQQKKSKRFEKEFTWVEKELSKIDKEKQRLDKERQKFIEDEQRLSKFRNSVIGDFTKEVLIETATGCLKLEGISPKFSQKLYEWEKSKGIAPENSAFNLLIPSVDSQKRSSIFRIKKKDLLQTLNRSKSVDTCSASPLISADSNQLLLNLSLHESNGQSTNEASFCSNIYSLHEIEPKALLIEVEDVLEETAAPLVLETVDVPIQVPMYKIEPFKTFCTSQTCRPKVLGVDNNRQAQLIYKSISNLFLLLKELDQNVAHNENKKTLNLQYDNKLERIFNKVLYLQNMTFKFASQVKIDGCLGNSIADSLDNIHVITSEIIQLVQQLKSELSNKSIKQNSNSTETIRKIRGKFLELKRTVNYICATIDSLTVESDQNVQLKSTINEDSNFQSAHNGAIKKRLKYRQKTQSHQHQCVVVDDSDDDYGNDEKLKKLRRKRISKSSSSKSTASSEDNAKKERKCEDLIGPAQCSLETNNIHWDNNSNVLVETTKQVFSANSNVFEEHDLVANETNQEKQILSPNIRKMADNYDKIVLEKSFRRNTSAISNVRPMSTICIRDGQNDSLSNTIDFGITSYGSHKNLDVKVAEKALQPILRQQKIQKATEDFLNSIMVCSNNNNQQEINAFCSSITNGKNQHSIGLAAKLSSDDLNEVVLKKSASAGLINVTPDAYRHFYYSQADNLNKFSDIESPKSNKSKVKFGAIFDLRSKFRRIKMRKNQRSNKDTREHAVSTLCRQSLLINIWPDEDKIT